MAAAILMPLVVTPVVLVPLVVTPVVLMVEMPMVVMLVMLGAGLRTAPGA
ncbi:hypothetical protein [Streptomyces halobius]|uniref:Uncharacterized protein n=1 Tax=Streptomyces halobius TaxID=2879846 RepID=A0ABY4MCQ9_9ACTN|nr:hypothetical protein [Streptomyces halobius]UQA94106.1 hypothetical protein K9S39_21500 [Streptomyces halobius]